MTIARKMARWANALKYEDLPDKTIHEVKRCLLRKTALEHCVVCQIDNAVSVRIQEQIVT